MRIFMTDLSMEEQAALKNFIAQMKRIHDKENTTAYLYLVEGFTNIKDNYDVVASKVLDFEKAMDKAKVGPEVVNNFKTMHSSFNKLGTAVRDASDYLDAIAPDSTKLNAKISMLEKKMTALEKKIQK
jgi:hypothetical protein